MCIFEYLHEYMVKETYMCIIEEYLHECIVNQSDISVLSSRIFMNIWLNRRICVYMLFVFNNDTINEIKMYSLQVIVFDINSQ